MKLTAKIDLEVPAAFVFDTLTDNASWEREAIRNGVLGLADAGSRFADLAAHLYDPPGA